MLKTIDVKVFKEKGLNNKKLLEAARKINNNYSKENIERFQKELIKAKLYLPLIIDKKKQREEIPILVTQNKNQKRERYTLVFTNYNEFVALQEEYPLTDYKILEVDYEDMNSILISSNLKGYIIDIYGAEIYIYHANI